MTHSFARSTRYALLGALFLPLGFAACSEDSDSSPHDDSTGGMAGSGATGGSSSGGQGGEGGQGIDTTKHVYEADDPLISYMGRFMTTDAKAPRFSAPAAQITVRFRGDSVTALLDDEFKWGNNRNFYDVVLDGEIVDKVAVDKGAHQVTLVSDVPPGEHTLTLVKRTEASIGRGTFKGFEVGGVLLEPPTPPSRRIVFIGDSITAGSGIEAVDGSDECSENPFGEIGNGGWGQPYHNAHLSYAAVAARELNAQYHITAVSGIGLVRNYSSQYDARPMPEVYDLVFAELTPAIIGGGQGGAGGEGSVDPAALWDTSKFVPDVVVVALGTNDFSPGDNPPEDPRPAMEIPTFVGAYIEFIDQLKEHYPDAEYFAASSPMLGDGWPNASDTFRTDQRNAIAEVVAHYDDAGDDHVHAILVNKFTGTGCGTHPGAEQHAEIGEAVAGDIQEVMGW
jgi:lysophospholipase L1-like esterase